MKAAFSLVLLSLATSLCAQDFCGTIKLTISKNGQTAPTIMYACGEDFLVRYDLKANGTTTQTDFLGNTSTGKSFLRSNLGGKEFAVEVKDADIASNLGIANTTLTGEKLQISGFNCELIKILHADGSVTEAWISKDAGIDFGKLSKFLKDDAASAAINKMGISATPIKSSTKDKNGFENYSFQIQSVEKGTVDKKLFEVSVQPIQTK